MKAYGTLLHSDVAFPLDLSHETAARYEVVLSSRLPVSLKRRIAPVCARERLIYQAHGRHVYLHSDGNPSNYVSGQSWCYEVEGLVRFYWIGGESAIYYEIGDKGDLRLLAFWFIHLLLPLYLTLEEKYDFLHAGAVEVAGKAILFIAPSMGGKSAMTDHFIRQGHTLISDDKVGTFSGDGKFYAVASHPYHRPYRRHEDLGYRVKQIADRFKPIHAIYQLQRSAADALVAIEEIPGYRKFDVLMPNYLFTFIHLRKKRLEYLASMLNQVRVFGIKVPWDLQQLERVRQVICSHCTTLP